jgi:hypothetical protein
MGKPTGKTTLLSILLSCRARGGQLARFIHETGPRVF